MHNLQGIFQREHLVATWNCWQAFLFPSARLVKSGKQSTLWRILDCVWIQNSIIVQSSCQFYSVAMANPGCWILDHWLLITALKSKAINKVKSYGSTEAQKCFQCSFRFCLVVFMAHLWLYIHDVNWVLFQAEWGSFDHLVAAHCGTTVSLVNLCVVLNCSCGLLLI